MPVGLPLGCERRRPKADDGSSTTRSEPAVRRGENICQSSLRDAIANCADIDSIETALFHALEVACSGEGELKSKPVFSLHPLTDMGNRIANRQTRSAVSARHPLRRLHRVVAGKRTGHYRLGVTNQQPSLLAGNKEIVDPVGLAGRRRGASCRSTASNFQSLRKSDLRSEHFRTLARGAVARLGNMSSSTWRARCRAGRCCWRIPAAHTAGNTCCRACRCRR